MKQNIHLRINSNVKKSFWCTSKNGTIVRDRNVHELIRKGHHTQKLRSQ